VGESREASSTESAEALLLIISLNVQLRKGSGLFSWHSHISHNSVQKN
jgi:hypothetical protein